MTGKRYFELADGSSNKFWEVWVEGAGVSTRYGKIGAKGKVTVKDAGGDEEGRKLLEKLIREKIAKGYVEKTAAEAAPAPGGGFLAHFEHADGRFYEVELRGTDVVTRWGKGPGPGRERRAAHLRLNEADATREREMAFAAKQGFALVRTSGEAPTAAGLAAERDTAPPVGDLILPDEELVTYGWVLSRQRGRYRVAVQGRPFRSGEELQVQLPDAASVPELEARIAEDRAGEADWLACANRLQERGDPRGELIVSQHGLATASEAIVRSIQEAQAAHLSRHLEHLVPPRFAAQAARPRAARSGVLHLSDSTWAFGHLATAVLSRLHEDDPHSLPELVREVLLHPAGRFLHALAIAQDGEPNLDSDYPAVVAALAGLVHPMLRRLEIGRCRTFQGSPSYDHPLGDLSPIRAAFPGLRELALAGSSFGAVDLPGLVDLSVEGGYYSSAALGWNVDGFLESLGGLLEQGRLPDLRRLAIGVELDVRVCTLLSSSGILDRIERLHLKGGTLSDEGARALASREVRPLAELVVEPHEEDFGDAGREALKPLALRIEYLSGRRGEYA